MAQAQEDVRDPFLYTRYLQALERTQPEEPEEPSPGHVIRHCHHCGQRAMYRLDPEGNWYTCLHCGEYD